MTAYTVIVALVFLQAAEEQASKPCHRKNKISSKKPMVMSRWPSLEPDHCASLWDHKTWKHYSVRLPSSARMEQVMCSKVKSISICTMTPLGIPLLMLNLVSYFPEIHLRLRLRSLWVSVLPTYRMVYLYYFPAISTYLLLIYALPFVWYFYGWFFFIFWPGLHVLLYCLMKYIILWWWPRVSNHLCLADWSAPSGTYLSSQQKKWQGSLHIQDHPKPSDKLQPLPDSLTGLEALVMLTPYRYGFLPIGERLVVRQLQR